MDWLIKKNSSIDHNILIFYLRSWKIILLVTFSAIISSLKDKTKSLFTPWKVGSIGKSKYLFCPWFVVSARYLSQLIFLLEPDSNCFRSSMFSWVDKVTTGTWSLVLFLKIWIFVCYSSSYYNKIFKPFQFQFQN